MMFSPAEIAPCVGNYPCGPASTINNGERNGETRERGRRGREREQCLVGTHSTRDREDYLGVN